MKNKLISLLLLLVMLSSMATTAYAKEFTNETDWNVAFNVRGTDLDSNFNSGEIDEVFRKMQPGDNAKITVTLQNDYAETTDWYMTNKVLESLEEHGENDAIASGGAYTYRLVYYGPGTDENGNVLYDSEALGGEDETDADKEAGVGLNAATNALEDYFYLDTLAFGDDGTITLEVALDGETQGNDYQDTLAQVQMNFAVELNDDSETPSPTGSATTTVSPTSSNAVRVNSTSVVYTGDENELLPFIIAAAISGVLLLVFAIYSLNTHKRQKKEGQ